MDPVRERTPAASIRRARLRTTGYINDLLEVVRIPGEVDDDQLLTLVTLLRVEAALTDNHGPMPVISATRPATPARPPRRGVIARALLTVWTTATCTVPWAAARARSKGLNESAYGFDDQRPDERPLQDVC